MIMKRSLMTLICVLLLASCGQNDKSSETKNYIAQVEKETQANEQPETIDLSHLNQAPEIDIATLKKRNLFDASAVQAVIDGAASGITRKVADMQLIGIFHIEKKKWAIIRASGKIYKVVAGDKIGAAQTVQKITDDSVTIIRDSGDEKQAFTLTLQTQNKEVDK